MPYCAGCGTVVPSESPNCPGCGRPQETVVTPTLRRTEGLAVASLVLGLVGLSGCPLVASIVAIVLGMQARARLAADPNLEGLGLATAGIVLGWVGIGVAILGFLTFFVGFLPAFFGP